MQESGNEIIDSTSVLVVDDDQAIQDTLREILQDEGYRVQTAGNGVEALRVLRRVRPSLIVLDLNMPILSGDEFRVVQCLDPALRDIPTVVLSAVDRLDARTPGLGVEVCLAKPIKLGDLLAVVKRFCGPAGA